MSSEFSVFNAGCGVRFQSKNVLTVAFMQGIKNTCLVLFLQLLRFLLCLSHVSSLIVSAVIRGRNIHESLYGPCNNFNTLETEHCKESLSMFLTMHSKWEIINFAVKIWKTQSVPKIIYSLIKWLVVRII